MLSLVYVTVAPEFQFHKGAIRTKIPVSGDKDNDDFNSIKVRLEQAAAMNYAADT